jgi:hypothetical protein
MGLQEERVIRESCMVDGLIGRHGVMSKSGPIFKFKRHLDLRDTCGV